VDGAVGAHGAQQDLTTIVLVLGPADHLFHGVKHLLPLLCFGGVLLISRFPTHGYLASSEPVLNGLARTVDDVPQES
jgi:hypothetical protein